MLALRTLALVGLVALAHTAAAADEPKEPTKEPSPAKPVPEPRSFVTTHAGRFGGEPVAYTATAGETYLRDAKGEPTASIFSFAYVKDGVKDPASRPVTFLWNGGPGSSSIWLHMGSMGPRRVAVPSDARPAGSPPYAVEDNTGALLDVTDLVFVDPVGTGFSHALGSHEDKEFWGLNPDADSVADFIRAWLTKNKRWASPKYLAGESFGTTRAAAVAGRLEGGDRGISLNGLVLVSEALDYQGSTPAPDNLIAYVTYLPTEAATAWYHGKVQDAPKDLEAFLDEVRRFAVDEYAPALFRGNGLDPETRARVRKRLAHDLGLTEDYVERADLRVLANRFRKELLRAEGKAVGRLDSRYVGDDLDDTAAEPDGDAASYGIDGAYVASFNDYLDRELAVQMDRPYTVSGQVQKDWKWRPVPEEREWEPSYVDVTRDLSRALRRNPSLRVMVAAGYYDFATPFFDAEYTLGRHGILADQVTFHHYEAGHMMYLNRPSLDALQADIRSFLRGAGR
ncbi:MAG: hypothetical protein LJF15_17020 [Acidobacteria bacterium]|jgi:carboxypeptidase C (cathepsin A)|nr:hypothetical protein [Acidobacteriota bacterium]